MFNIKTNKILSEENIRKIIMLGISLKDIATNIQDKCLEEYNPNKTYMKDSYVTYDGYLWKAKTVSTGEFNSDKWLKQNDELSLITKSDIESMVNLSSEELVTLQNILLDSSIELSHTWSSSKIYGEIQNAIKKGEAFTLSKLASTMTASFEIATSTADMTEGNILYLLNTGTNAYDIYALIEGTPKVIASTTIDLSQYVKLTDLEANYYDKATSDGKYATITTVDGKVDKTSILSTMSSTPSDDKLLSEKAIDDTFVKKTDITTTINSSSTDTQLPSAKSVYSAIDNVRGRLNKITKFTKDSTSYATLSEFIKNHDFFKLSESSIYVFSANGFDDLPSTNWDYTIKMYNTNGAIHVVAYRFISDNEYFVRSFTYTGDWAGGWQRLCTTSVADVGKTNIAPADTDTTTFVNFVGNPNCNYCVRNGICFVTLWGVQITSAGGTLFSGVILPKCAIGHGGVLMTGDQDATPHAYVFVLPNTGELCFNVKDANVKLYGSFSYPVA